MNSTQRSDLDLATEAFVRGFCYTRSRTHPYLFTTFDGVWRVCDAKRKNPIDCRREEWITCSVSPAETVKLAQRNAIGRYVICAILPQGESNESLRHEYKSLGYRLHCTEPVMIHRLKRIPKYTADITIRQIMNRELADRFTKAWKQRPMKDDLLRDDAPSRQYVAISNDADDKIVGGVTSVNAGDGGELNATWVSTMYVSTPFRRRGIGKALLARLLRDDRSRGVTMTALTASHAGAMLYPLLGSEQVGMLYAFGPRK